MPERQNPISSDTGMCQEHGNVLPCEICGNKQEAVPSEKEITWEKHRADVDKIADRLGKGVDEKIKEAVAALMVYEFPTSGSCEGHAHEEVEEEHGLPYPWVEIYAPEPEGLREGGEADKKQKEQEWIAENLKQQQKMMEYFLEFYQGRETPFDARLSFDRIGRFGGFRVQSFGAEITKILPTEEQKIKLDLYRKEMDDFVNFLKDKYLK